MNEGWDALVATGQPRRQADRAERKASAPHVGVIWVFVLPWDLSLHKTVKLEFLTKMIENWVKTQTDS